jgi:hypothetical protein
MNAAPPAPRGPVRRFTCRSAGFALACVVLAAAQAATDLPLAFRKVVLAKDFFAEGATAGDFNRDGRMDIAAGPFWFEGPDFTVRHEIYPAVAFDLLKYSKNFVAFAYDFNADGWPDVLVLGFPGEDASWFENPRGANSPWTRHLVFPTVGNESPTFADITGDGRPEIVCVSDGRFGWAGPADWRHADQPWIFHPITAPGDLKQFTHGLGLGDINGDGRTDLLERTGWSAQPATLAGDPVWAKQEVPFAPGRGGAQMYAADLNGDGLADVVTAQDAHGYGLSWFEQRREAGGQATWQEHVILSTQAGEKKSGVQFSQLHSLAVADMDGDGRLDLITAKRWWAHGPEGDPEPNAPAVVYIFRQVRAPDGSVAFTPQRVDDQSGAGTQLTVTDLNQDGRPDIVTANKRGIFVFLSSNPTAP